MPALTTCCVGPVPEVLNRVSCNSGVPWLLKGLNEVLQIVIALKVVQTCTIMRQLMEYTFQLDSPESFKGKRQQGGATSWHFTQRSGN